MSSLPSGHCSLSVKPAQYTRFYFSQSLCAKNPLEHPNLLTHLPWSHLLQFWSFTQPIRFMPLNILELIFLILIYLPSSMYNPLHLSQLKSSLPNSYHPPSLLLIYSFKDSISHSSPLQSYPTTSLFTSLLFLFSYSWKPCFSWERIVWRIAYEGRADQPQRWRVQGRRLGTQAITYNK